MNKSIIGTILITLVLTAPLAAQVTRTPVIDKYGNHLVVDTNAKKDLSQRIYGQLPNIRLFGFQEERLTKTTVQNLSSKLFSDYKDVLKINPTQVQFRKAVTDDQLWFISYQQTVDDIPVLGTQIGYTVDQDGDIVALGTDIYQDIEVPTTPEVSEQAAHQTAKNAFSTDSSRTLDAGTLTIYPVTIDSVITFYLTWKVHLSSQKPLKNIVYFVDAINGKIVDQFNNLSDHNLLKKTYAPVLNKSDDVDSLNTDPNSIDAAVYSNQVQSYNVHGTITGDYYPEYYYDSPVNTNFKTTGIKVYNYAGVLVGGGSSNSNGYYSINYSSSYSTHYVHIPLQNDWVKVIDGGSVAKQVFSYTPGSSVQKDADFSAGDGPNVGIILM